jgi:hypothetical protein
LLRRDLGLDGISIDRQGVFSLPHHLSQYRVPSRPQHHIRPSLGEIVGEEGDAEVARAKPGDTPLTAEMRYGFGLTACVRANANDRFGRLGNTVTAFVIRDGQVINALDEKQGSW